jgi:Arc/MetJ family transcription regulator
MRTRIDIDAQLLASAMAASGLTTKRATVEEALRRMARHEARRNAVNDMAGLGWDGNLDAMRRDAPAIAG